MKLVNWELFILLLVMDGLLYKEESYKIMGACFEVHKRLGCGFTEKVYQEALALELSMQGIPFAREVPFDIIYRKNKLNLRYIADFICFKKIILEMKAVEYLHPKHESQVLNYLSASKLKLGLLVNFGEESLKSKRLVYSFK